MGQGYLWSTSRNVLGEEESKDLEFKNTRHGAQNKSQKRHVSVLNFHPHRPNIISTAARLASQPRSTRASANCLSTIWRSLDNTVPPSPKGDMVASAQKIKAHPEAKRKQSVAVQPPEKAALWCGIRPKWATAAMLDGLKDRGGRELYARRFNDVWAGRWPRREGRGHVAGEVDLRKG